MPNNMAVHYQQRQYVTVPFVTDINVDAHQVGGQPWSYHLASNQHHKLPAHHSRPVLYRNMGWTWRRPICPSC